MLERMIQRATPHLSNVGSMNARHVHVSECRRTVVRGWRTHPWIAVLLALYCTLNAVPLHGYQTDSADLKTKTIDSGEPLEADFFENRIRPLLVDKCFSCHSTETESNGGLVLDSRTSILAGGDSGPAARVDTPESSLLIRAVEYRDPKLQMPPDGRLSPSEIEALRRWIGHGLPSPDSFSADPSDKGSNKPKSTSQLSVVRAFDHWAYRPIVSSEFPAGRPLSPARNETAEATNPNPPNGLNPIDAWLHLAHEEHGSSPSPVVSDRVWFRRVWVDLHGLNPTAEEYARWDLSEDLSTDATETNSTTPNPPLSPDQREAIVDAILNSPRYGERFARHWMDVVRFAESLTLRGFILPDAWRFRNYLIDSFNEDIPFDQMIREQIAGDLLPYESVNQAQRQWIATTGLAIGDHNYEEQDKQQLEMDAIDEQIDVIGKAFLAQTLSCARCHDHKFDPIPTRDYYALAGILKSSVAMEHENVSKWIRMPLPLPPDVAKQFDVAAERHKSIRAEIDAIKKKIGGSAKSNRIARSQELPGIVIDNASARIVGDWQTSSSVQEFVDSEYLHDKNSGRGEKSVTFEPSAIEPGTYQVRMSYAHGENRSSKTIVRIFSADGEALVKVNQRKPADENGLWQPLGKFRFEPGGQAFVIVSNEDSDGHVIADAIQFLPETSTNTPSPQSSGLKPQDPVANSSGNNAAASVDDESLSTKLKSLEQEAAELASMIDSRPTVQTLRASTEPKDIPIHIRGSVHRLGEIAPRGFLACIDHHNPELHSRTAIPPKSNGRVELGNWLTDRSNPLTARVYVNRVWYWLMGQGIVPTVDNFGTTGRPPSHPQLLDALAAEFIQSGWSTKKLVKKIVLSDAYRRDLTASESALQSDPENNFFGRGIMKRLDAESLRDSMLQASGELERPTRVASTIRAKTKDDYRYEHPVGLPSIYLPWFRNSPPELIREFDGANPSFSISIRNRSTVATQALTLMNSPWVHERAKIAADKLALAGLRNAFDHDEATTLSQIYLQTLGRLPSPEELSWSRRLLELGDRADLIHALLSSIDFRYLE